MSQDNISSRVARVRAKRIVENGAGTYTASFDLPAGAILLDAFVHAEALWAAATSAVLKAGDATDDDGIFVGVNLKATDLLAGESISLMRPGGKQGADVDFPDPTAASLAAGSNVHVRRRLLSAARVISFVVTSVGAGTTGSTVVGIEYAMPVIEANVSQ